MSKRTFTFMTLLTFLLLGFQKCPSEKATSTTAAVSTPESGHEHGNGGDDLQYSDVAWFAQAAREVNYCIQVQAGFPLSYSQASSSMKSALSTWNAFMTANGRTMYSTSVIAKNYKLITECASADLILNLGGAPPKRTHSAVGDSIRAAFDPKTNWGSGQIWLSADAFNFADDFRFEGALLHSLGKVMGFGPVSGTIMDPNWEKWLKAPTSAALRLKLTSIENERRLAGNLSNISGTVALTPALKSLFSITTKDDVVLADVDLDQRVLKLQGKTLNFNILFSRKLRRGFSHRAVYFDTNAIYSFMRTVPHFLSEDDAEYVDIIQFTNVPGRPQLVMELNGDTRISLHLME